MSFAFALQFQPALLKQGSLQGDSSTNSLTSGSRDDVQIERFDVSGKRKLLQSKFAGRCVRRRAGAGDLVRNYFCKQCTCASFRNVETNMLLDFVSDKMLVP